MEELYQLSDKQLREKCLHYGLPNVPVTDSSRKILIRKLHAAMTGNTSTTGRSGKTQQNKVHSPEKPKSTKAASPITRRKTIAKTITTTISSGDEDDINTKTNRSTAINRRQTVAASAAPKLYNQRIIPMEFESQANSTRIGETNSTEQRQRRSVSLSKTGVLTTSYIQETVPLRSTYEQQEEDDNEQEQQDEVDDVEMESLPDTGRSIFSSSNYNQNNYTQNNYSNPSYSTTNYANLTMPPPAEPSVPKLYPNLYSADLQSGYYNSFDGIRASHSSSMNQKKLGFTYNPPTSYIPPQRTPSPTAGNTRKTFGGNTFTNSLANSTNLNSTSTYPSSSSKRYTLGGTIKRNTAHALDYESGASSSDDQYEEQNLNKFSRNTDSFKPESSFTKRTTTSYTSSASPTIGNRYSSYSPMAPKRRRGTYEDDNGITFAQFWTTMEQRYHLKQAFFFIMCFVAAVFIYVFFLQ